MSLEEPYKLPEAWLACAPKFKANAASFLVAFKYLAVKLPTKVKVAKPVPALSLAPAVATKVLPTLSLIAEAAAALEALATTNEALGQRTYQLLLSIVTPAASIP